MARIYFRKIRSRRLYANWASFRRVIVDSHKNEVAPKLQEAFQARVSGWSVPVDFQVEMVLGNEGVETYVFPGGEGARFWSYVSRGVEGHPIFPRRQWSTRGSFKGQAWGRSFRRAALKLHNYRSMTAPGNVYGRAKFRAFSGYRPFIPWWPGITPRLFEENVAEDLRPWYTRTMENTLRRAVRAAKREAKERM